VGDTAAPSAAGVPEAARTQCAGLASQIDVQAGEKTRAVDHAKTLTWTGARRQPNCSTAAASIFES